MTRLALALALVLVALLAFRPSAPRAAAKRGDMGILVSDLSPEACRAAGVNSGVLVVDVVPDGPADKKGIVEGDIITEYENEPVRSAALLLGRIRHDGPGFLAGVRIRHDGVDRWIGFIPLEAAPEPPPTADEVAERFGRLEQEIDALEARIVSLEKARAIPRRQVLPKTPEETDTPK
jgi:hypothetical protein